MVLRMCVQVRRRSYRHVVSTVCKCVRKLSTWSFPTPPRVKLSVWYDSVCKNWHLLQPNMHSITLQTLNLSICFACKTLQQKNTVQDDKFYLGRRLGSGSFGQVFLAKNRRGKELAVKVEHLGFCSKSSFHVSWKRCSCSERFVGW